MSENLDNNVNIKLKKIEAPSLTSSKYGKNIRDQFDNIDKNFQRVSNRDYVEGKSGANINITDLPLIEWNKQEIFQGFTTLGQDMVESITRVDIDWETDWDNELCDFKEEFYSRHSKLAPVSYIDNDNQEVTVYFYDYIKNNQYITVLYTLFDVEQVDEESNRHYICSPQVYTFLDQRYANVKEHGGINEADFKLGQQDVSCSITLRYTDDIPLFTRSNPFPTIYYDDSDNQFKWQIYDSKTGIRAQGPKGNNGSSTSLWIVRVRVIDNMTLGTENSLLVPAGDVATVTDVATLNDERGAWEWVPISELADKPVNGDACIALSVPISVGTDDSSDDVLVDAYVSPIFVYRNSDDSSDDSSDDADSYPRYVLLNSSNGINRNIQLNQLQNVFLGIGNSELGGIYIPHAANDTKGAHFLYNETVNDNKHTLHVVSKVNTDSLDYSRPYDNVNDSNSKLDVQYTEVDINGSSASINIKNDVRIASSGKTTIDAKEGVDLMTNNEYDITLTGKNINLKAGTENSNGLVKSDTPITAKVNKVSNVYLGCPIGTIVMWPGTSLPDGWLWCNGDKIFGYREADHFTPTISEYQELCNVIGSNYYKDGDNAAEYVRLPDFRRCFPLGAAVGEDWSCGRQRFNTGLGKTDGEHEVTLMENEMPKHNHYILTGGFAGGGSNNVVMFRSGTTNVGVGDDAVIKYRDVTYVEDVENKLIQETGSSKPHNNIPPFLAINFIIKYK